MRICFVLIQNRRILVLILQCTCYVTPSILGDVMPQLCFGLGCRWPSPSSGVPIAFKCYLDSMKRRLDPKHCTSNDGERRFSPIGLRGSIFGLTQHFAQHTLIKLAPYHFLPPKTTHTQSSSMFDFVGPRTNNADDKKRKLFFTGIHMLFHSIPALRRTSSFRSTHVSAQRNSFQ